MDKPVDVVERVARAIAKELTGGFPAGPKSIDHKAAKAAIAEVVRAMGEPSDDMLVAACGDASRVAVTYEENTQVFAAMLTAWKRENGVD